ncbi:hypothetical protein BY996DRAFT_6431618 [Phakopsora pachyrhizi]|uniref:Amidohydrolase-related domain-containing protein n=1 Tax=Phakopsora pachyrhizi TaxID=170000 RepID=A0AAV0ASB3_PHAPC|nr:hypothetical protein BY996DRAFT_6431618 [Phakopsora pachyrhizi]CAH7672326.1 hypothetical protein PPACK8108_LOCUS7136 [Phakopsora pachyrhizi]
MPKKLPPSLPISAFSPITPPYQSSRQNARRTTPLLVIDTHVLLLLDDKESIQSGIRLWQQSVSGLCDRLSEQLSPAITPCSVVDQARTGLNGFIYMHRQPDYLLRDATFDDQDHGPSSSIQWEKEVQQIMALNSVQVGFEVCPPLAQVIWAPLGQGPRVLGPYLDHISRANSRVVACCHLIERPSSRRRHDFSRPDLIESLKHLGERGLGVELNVEGNHDRSAALILEEILEIVSAVRNAQELKNETKFVICQMGKPEMISSQSVVPSSASYSSILSRLFSLSLFSNLHIKLSGLPLLIDDDLTSRAREYYVTYKRPYQSISLDSLTLEASNGDDDTVSSVEYRSNDRAQGDLAWREVKKRMKFYLEPILEAFGDHRIMYSSDYPFFGMNDQTEREKSPTGHYEYQFELYRECLAELGLENESLDNIFGLNARLSLDCFSICLKKKTDFLLFILIYF